MNENLLKQIKEEEGLVLHAYKDHLGYLTIGYGRLIDKNKGGGITKEEAEYLLKNDIERFINEIKKNISFFNDLNDARQAVIINMAFQMGISGLLGFKNTLKFIENKEFDKAADNMMLSKWATQTPSRAKRLSEQIRSGNFVFK